MAKFLTAESVARAMTRLRESSAKSRVCEYLIGLRALKLAGSDELGLGESVPEYVRAVNDFTRCIPEGVESSFSGSPYYNPFGRQAKFKSPRFPSNGPSNTMHGWTEANSPFEAVLTLATKGIRRREVTREQLRAFFLLKSAPLESRPRLEDAAVWYFRTSDVSLSDDSPPNGEDLESRFIQEVGLSAEAVGALFQTSTEVPGNEITTALDSSDA